MSKILDLTDNLLQRRRNYEFINDMDDVTSGGRYTTLVAAGASIVTSNTPGAAATLATGATINTPALVALTNLPFLMTKDLPAFFEARLKYTEAATNKADLFVGFSSLFPADTLSTQGLGPNSSFSGAGFYKLDGQLNWGVMVSNAGVQTLVPLTSLVAINKLAAATGVGAYQVLKIEITNVTATAADVLFYIDTVLVYAIKGWTWTGSVAMSAGVEIKDGSAVSESCVLDYFVGAMARF